MANISYEVTRWDVSCCHNTHPTHSGYAESVILGITATDSVSGKSAYKDERISINPCVELAQFEAGAEAFVEGVIGSGGWYLELQTRIAAQLSAPEPAPSREMPDFASMNIGDGYSELPSEEEAEAPAEEAEEAEEVEAEEAVAEEEEAEEAVAEEEEAEEAAEETAEEETAEEEAEEEETEEEAEEEEE